MSRSPLPWDIQAARDALAASSAAQVAAEGTLRDAVKEYAACEERYRRALAGAIIELRANGPATIAQDLARGQEAVAKLRFHRDVAEGMKEAALQVGWRASADRRDAQALAAWSMKRDLRDDFEGQREPSVIGGRA